MMKAFDRVDRDCLLAKLLSVGVHGQFYNILRHLYSTSRARVDVNGHLTNYFDIECSVEQGNKISPTLFGLYINDLAIELKCMNLGIMINGENICILLYADDIVILSENEEKLQNMLNKVSDWCKNWRMKINPTKTNIVHFRKQSQNKTDYLFKIGDDIISVAPSYKYLGCVLTDTLDFTETANILAESAGRALGGLLNKAKALNGLTFNVFTKLYDTSVIPVMDYSSGVWGYKKYAKCDTIQNRAIRSFLGVHKHASNLAINGDTGWQAPTMRHHLNMLRLWDRLVEMPDDRITKKVFLWDYAHSHGWCSDVKRVFEQLNLLDLYTTKSMSNLSLDNLLCHAKETFTRIYADQWQQDLVSQPKLRTYRQIKHELGCENYVSMQLPKHLRSYIAQIRTGTLPLRIETGRFRNLKIEERLCLLCKEPNKVETEYHFLFECPFYLFLRLSFYNCISNIKPNITTIPYSERLACMLTDKRLIYKSALFIQDCYMKRSEALYVSDIN
jgi:hypothetical protein